MMDWLMASVDFVLDPPNRDQGGLCWGSSCDPEMVMLRPGSIRAELIGADVISSEEKAFTKGIFIPVLLS